MTVNRKLTLSSLQSEVEELRKSIAKLQSQLKNVKGEQGPKGDPGDPSLVTVADDVSFSYIVPVNGKVVFNAATHTLSVFFDGRWYSQSLV